jgi:UDP-N-acetylmuramoyl-L-alanyl-D-glutamate--2,6-diaminopimelate ligase
LALVLDGLAPVASSRGAGLIAVFGSSGERDVLKRPMMGRVAGERCRVAVLTNEEPRGEDEMSIIEQIAAGAEQAGMRRHRDLFLITDRAAAIGKAFAVAQPGDIVVLAGKGHEQAMEMAYGTIPWNEAEIARQTLKAMGYGG